jgi:hypothetical protein
MATGDNEYNDCGNPYEGLTYWHQTFDGFLNQYWPNNGLNAVSQPNRIENIFFIRKRTLFVILNIVGGRVHNRTEWNERLLGNYNWTRSLIEEHVRTKKNANLVVVMAHAVETTNHKAFFDNMCNYTRDVLNNTLPILHMNGDTHVWNYQPYYFKQTNWLRITVDGDTKKYPLRVTVDASISNVNNSVKYIR